MNTSTEEFKEVFVEQASRISSNNFLESNDTSLDFGAQNQLKKLHTNHSMNTSHNRSLSANIRMSLAQPTILDDTLVESDKC